MDTATKMKRTLVGLKGHLTRQINKCQNLSQQSTVDYFELEDLLQVAESKFAHIKQHMNLYLTELQSTSIESSELDEVIDELAQYEEDIRVKLLPYKKQIAKNKLTVTSTVRTDPEVKLPQINIPTFSGDENESWDDFWSKFVDAVDSKTNIPQTTKFTYLQGLLRKEALKVISNITLTSDGYASAVQLLQTNYDNKERTVTVLVQKLLDLPSANNSAESLQNFRLELESLLKALSLKVQIQSAEWMTKVVVKRKLPRETLDKLCTIYNTTFLTLKEITEGLHTLVERQRANQDGEKVTNSSTNSHRSSTQVDTSIKPKQTLNKSNKFTSKTTLSTGKRSGNSWASNNKLLNQLIEKEFPDYQVPSNLKVLGVEWNTNTDEMNVNKLLRVTAHVFDFLSKVGIRHKFPNPVHYWIKRAQQETYGSEFENLSDKLTKSLGICEKEYKKH
ncbi:uncharacterized protein [Procambarus clarkii]|uniref:uncharacterized protein n=1 Tax=Procambarus clarkii TaxID=6728 RepID=UPI003742882F